MPSIWNPLSGEVKKVNVYTEVNGTTLIPLTFHPNESFFVIFSSEQETKHICKIESGTRQLFPLNGESGNITAMPEFIFTDDGNITCYSAKEEVFSVTTSQGEKKNVKSTVPEIIELNNFKGKIVFNSLNTNKIDSVDISGFQPFTDFQQAEIKYFAGTAHYKIDFDIPESFVKSKDVVLSFGKFDADGEVYLNGDFIGNIWLPGTSLPIGGKLKANNHLEIKLATTCRNRFIGDFVEYGEIRNLWTSAPVNNFLDKNSALKPSGIIGSLKLLKIK